MIAKVRIAPREHWCQSDEDTYTSLSKSIGAQVEILIDKVEKSPCGGRGWLVSESSANALNTLAGAPSEDFGRPLRICEHYLEMD